jgi:ankyrin repeat protein
LTNIKSILFFLFKIRKNSMNKLKNMIKYVAVGGYMVTSNSLLGGLHPFFGGGANAVDVPAYTPTYGSTYGGVEDSSLAGPIRAFGGTPAETSVISSFGAEAGGVDGDIQVTFPGDRTTLLGQNSGIGGEHYAAVGSGTQSGGGGSGIGAAADPALAIYEAIENGDTGAVRALLDRYSFDVNARDRDRQTLLYKAARAGNVDMVEMLLSAGANVNARSGYETTPLHWVARSGNRDIAEMLVDKGADVNARDSSGNTPLHRAALADKVDWIAKRFSHKGVNFDVLDSAGTIEFLISRGADVNAKDNGGGVPLACAVGSSSPNLDAIRALIAAGADVKAVDKEGGTIFHRAATWNGNLEVAHVLFDTLEARGEDIPAFINRLNSFGETALDMSNEYGDQQMQDLLRQYGAKTGDEVRAANIKRDAHIKQAANPGVLRRAWKKIRGQ